MTVIADSHTRANDSGTEMPVKQGHENQHRRRGWPCHSPLGSPHDEGRAALSAPADAIIPLRITADRVLIRADREDRAPVQRDSGLYTAGSLTAAVEGTDAEDSWFVGTVIQVGPLVNRLNHRRAILRWVLEMEAEGHDLALTELRALRQRIEDLPAETPEPIRVGDRVCFSWAAGQQITIDRERYIIARASDVLGVLEEDK